MMTADEALRRLKEGNRRFISGKGGRDLNFEHTRRKALVEDQAPFAIVLGCSDSRVPLELIFDQGMGDLFVVRIAGNIVAPSQLGSMEFAAEQFGTPLLVVLGHSKCGAVAATVDQVLNPTRAITPNIRVIADRIEPVVRKRLERDPGIDREKLLNLVVGDNVRAAVEGLADGSALLADRVRRGRLTLVGAEYSLETGEVEFF